MPLITFKIMTAIMSVRKLFRNIADEIKYVGIEPGYHILDFGCGPGFNTIPAAKIIGSNGTIYALDLHKQAADIIKKKAEKHKLKNIETIISDCETGLDDNTIDVVYLHNTLPLIKNKENVLDEIHRILKPDGKLSYMSRSISRIKGDDSMNDKQLTQYLEAENRFKLIKNKNNHLIFVKIM